MSSVMTTARSVKERFLGSTAHWMAVGMVRRVSQHRRTDRCLGHPQRPRCLISSLAQPVMGPPRPRRGGGHWLQQAAGKLTNY